MEAKAVVGKINENYIMSMAETAARLVEKVPVDTASVEQYSDILQDIKMTGIDSSYAYLVDSEGTMVYHPTAEKIGVPVENVVVKGVVAELQAGKTPEDAVVTYEFKGAIKYSSYALTNSNMIVVVTADESDIMEPINEILKQLLVIAVIIAFICIVVGGVVGRFICIPIRQLTVIIDSTSRLDFRHHAYSDKLCKRKDETGEMAR